MNYIILDMEWNQSYPKTDSEGKKKKSPMNEIIEIGAIKLNEKMEFVDAFKSLVRPCYIKKLNSHVKKLTGITSEMLRHGTWFPEVVVDFREWCGEERVFLTWGYDDIPMLESCLKLYGLESGWIGRWYNLQVIFNAQTDGGKNQRSLKSAVEYFNLTVDEEGHPQHDALNDAGYTAMVCRCLDLKKGIDEYDRNTKSMSPSVIAFGELKVESRRQFPCTVIGGRSQCPEAFSVNPCPRCGAPMVRSKWVRQGRGKMISIGECREHGRFFMQNSVVKNGEERTVRKTVYKSAPAAEEFYAERLSIEEQKSERKAANRAARRAGNEMEAEEA